MDSTQFYEEGAYLDKHPTWHTEDSAWKAGHFIDVLKKHGRTPASVVEVGCGAGQILQHVKSALTGDVAFTGLEIAPQAYEMAVANNPGNVEFMLGGFEKIEGRSFDLLIMADVFEHVEDYYGFLRQARRFAGEFLFHIPLDLSAQTVLRSGSLHRKRKNLGHLHYFSRITALETLEHCGYSLVDWRYTSSYTDLEQKSLAAKLMKYPRKLMFSALPEFTVRMLGGYSLLVLAR
jgi:ubiquinone/menaquinone biosynthesis C-methylase UbiE